MTFSQGIHGLGSTANADPNAWPLPTASTNAGPRRLHQDRGHGQPAAAAVRGISRPSSPPTANTPSRRCWSPSNAPMAGASSAAPSIPRRCSATIAGRRSAKLRYDIPNAIKQLTRAQLYAYADHGETYNIDPALGTPQHAAAAPRPAAARAPSGTASTGGPLGREGRRRPAPTTGAPSSFSARSIDGERIDATPPQSSPDPPRR